MNYISNGIIGRFSLAIRNHQITHFGDDNDGMGMEVLFHSEI